MTRENKKPLLQYLSAALFYGVICKYDCVTSYDDVVIKKANSIGELRGIKPVFDGQIGFMINCDVVNALSDNIKPYLRSMSSMTEEERKELSKRYNWRINGVIQIRHHSDGYWDDDIECSTEDYLWLFTWLLKNHFDFMGLIPKGLALEAPEDMYKKGE